MRLSSFNRGEAGKVSMFAVFFILLVLAAIAVVVSNFVGPAKGWMGRLAKKPAPPMTKPKPELAPKPIKVAKPEPEKTVQQPTKPQPPPPPKPEKKRLDIKKLYDELFAKYKKKFPNPKVGKKYTVYMKSGVLEGTLKAFSDGKVVIKRPGVTMTCRIDMVSPRSYPTLFPKRAAKILALRELKKRLAEERAKEEAAAKAAGTAVASTSGSVKIPPPPPSSGKVVYDPTPGKTPDYIKKTALISFGEWIKMQQRHVGGKLAEKIYAKRVGGGVVVYVKTSKLFRKQNYDVRYSVTAAMWQVWGFKCADYGLVRDPQQAHLVILDANNKPVGGSRENDASNIWVVK